MSEFFPPNKIKLISETFWTFFFLITLKQSSNSINSPSWCFFLSDDSSPPFLVCLDIMLMLCFISDKS